MVKYFFMCLNTTFKNVKKFKEQLIIITNQCAVPMKFDLQHYRKTDIFFTPGTILILKLI